MFVAHFFQQINHWLLLSRRLTQTTGESITPAEYMIVQVGAEYFWVDGATRVPMLLDQP